MFLWVAIVAVVAAYSVLAVRLLGEDSPGAEIPYSVFREEVATDNVVRVETKGDSVSGVFASPVDTGSDGTILEFSTVRPSFADDDLLSDLVDAGVEVEARVPSNRNPLWQQLLLTLVPVVLLVSVLVWIFSRSSMGMRFGRSDARAWDGRGPGTTFEDVAGIDEAKAELVELVDFLRNPGRYSRLGADVPRGVMLSGPPGTGKTLLARAVAGEAGVPFFSMSASEFTEMLVGVGASRVRSLFRKAKEAAPAIIFIDELDAIGRARSAQGSSGEREGETTLNQILTEMDGFSNTDGVIVIGATNRPDVLDSALRRPGRFDRHVIVSPPDLDGRRAILELHTREVPLAADVDLRRVAATTPGMAGADLRNLVNEAAITAARDDRDRVCGDDFLRALEKIVLGTERAVVITPVERRRTAYHEAGHALVGMLQPGADPVRKISIIPRGRSLGVTYQSPDSDRYVFTEAYLRGRIMGLLGGRAAEELVFDEVTTGAEDDLEHVTRIARMMVARWGMSSEIGPVSHPVDAELSDPATAGVRRIITECYEASHALLARNRDRLDRLADALLESETLDQDAAYEVAGVVGEIPHDAIVVVVEP
jgi:cell division protease FtsH